VLGSKGWEDFYRPYRVRASKQTRSGACLGMTRTAKGHKIIISISTAVLKWDNMVDFINRNITSNLKAFFTKRMLGYIKLSKCTPARTVMLTVVWTITGIIIPAGFNLVFRAVTLTPDSFGTIWVSARF